MREVLDRRGIQLTKSLGQNFLHDAHQLERIVGAAGLTPADNVLEIGPGLGPLTQLLLAKAGKVLVEGTYVSHHSSGVLRIKGGAVQIN